MLDKINEKKEEAKNLVNSGDIEGAKNVRKELNELQEKFDILKDVIDPEGTGQIKNEPDGKLEVKTGENDSVKEFANAARAGFKNTMTEGTQADGGYTVPEDIQTKVNEYRSAKESLIDLVDVENVTTDKGSRTYKKRAQQTGFAKVGEGGKIPASATPKFERMEYTIEKYAGYLPVTNELIADTDTNLAGTLVNWLGDESRVTRNKVILDVAKTNPHESINGLDDIKKILNIKLGQAFKATSKVITNDDGLQWLDTLKDNEGKYILQPDPANPMKLRICAGATIVPIVVIPNSDLNSDTTTENHRKIPFIIGDLKEGIKFFDRNKMSIMTSNVASVGELSAFESDMTIFRAIEREDCKKKDTEAFVFAEFGLTEAAPTLGE